MPQMLQVLCASGMLDAGIPTSAVARELNVYLTPANRVQCCFREFDSTCSRFHNRRPCATTLVQDPHIRFLHLHAGLRPAPWTADAKVGLHNQRISQTVRIRLREALRVRHRGLKPECSSLS